MAAATTYVDYPIVLLSQPTQTKCWWASACMILKRGIPLEGEWVGDTGVCVPKTSSAGAST